MLPCAGLHGESRPKQVCPPPAPTPGPASLSVHWALSAPTARWGGGKWKIWVKSVGHLLVAGTISISPLLLSSALWPHRSQMGREEESPTSFQVEMLPASVNSLPEDFQLLQARGAECPLILTCDPSQREAIVSENASQPAVHVETLTSYTV